MPLSCRTQFLIAPCRGRGRCITLNMWVQTGQAYKKSTSCEAQPLCILIWDLKGPGVCNVMYVRTHICVCQNAGLCLEIANRDQQTLNKAPQLETHLAGFWVLTNELWFAVAGFSGQSKLESGLISVFIANSTILDINNPPPPPQKKTKKKQGFLALR